MYLAVTTAAEVAGVEASAVEAAVFSPNEKPVVAPVLAVAKKKTTQITIMRPLLKCPIRRFPSNKCLSN